MKVLALDIGARTEDILLYDSKEKNVENCTKMVLPSPSLVLAARVRETTQLNRDLFICGEIIGGGPITPALKIHVQKGLKVLMTKNAAYCLRNDLDQVTELGFEIVEERPLGFKGETIRTREVSIEKLGRFLNHFDQFLSSVDIVAVAVQDHGVPPKGISNRRFRIQKMAELLSKDSRPENLAFKEQEIPPYFLRMKSGAKASKKQLPKASVIVMDTAPAAIMGCLTEPDAMKSDPILAINVGNAHIMATILSRGKIVGLLEHHTHLLSSRQIERMLRNFAEGTLSDEEVLQKGGHGLFFLTDPPGFSEIEKIMVTGPNRGILSMTDLSIQIAAPAGDVMMTGPMGLVESTLRQTGKKD